MTLVTVWIATCHDFGSGHRGRLTNHSTTIAAQRKKNVGRLTLRWAASTKRSNAERWSAGGARLLGGTVFLFLHRPEPIQRARGRPPVGHEPETALPH